MLQYICVFFENGGSKMKEDICTIPINDVFMPKDGCPLCRMKSMLENNYVEYITGAAMMEPDVRVETNEKGFCYRHFDKMVNKGKRLPNALILQTHLEKISKELLPQNVKGKPDKKILAKIKQVEDSCFVCDKIEWGMKHMLETIFKSWENEPEFRKLFDEQPYICLNHYRVILEAAANKGISNKNLPEFYKSVSKLAGGYLETLKCDIAHFCSMFDYRRDGDNWGSSKDAIERSVEFLTSEKVSGDSNG